jgi:glycosyltransferase involved in cell wall biosynthesis
MIQSESNSTATPRFSIVIPAYNDWLPLQECLQSLARQQNAPSFEVVVVDDGSVDAAPETIRQWASVYPLAFLQQNHQGISAARNLGIRNSHGEILLFVDADCKVASNTLAALSSMIDRSPNQDSFQLRLVGDRANLVGRAEDLRLMTFQEHMLHSDGRVRYLNTAGFAVRRKSVNSKTNLFDPSALRAEDTLLLVELMQAGKPPLFVPEAVVEHAVPLSVTECLRKAVRSAIVEKRTYDVIAAKGIKIRLTDRERLTFLRSVWKASSERSIGRSAFFLLVLRQTVKRTISLALNLFSPFSRRS